MNGSFPSKSLALVTLKLRFQSKTCLPSENALHFGFSRTIFYKGFVSFYKGFKQK